ncbi:polymorphic toxin-type HINT domain-containing protein [Streptomyces polyrhachis]|uniref:Polymorphic toxin-type HINT domain-containing protein n=1 Tax=Streptomyces polyrhachis TaxID=1282885 RepID=A0ABW2GKI0_9ACTN
MTTPSARPGRFAKRLAGALGLAMLPGLLAPSVASGAEALGRPDLKTPPSAKLSPFAAQANAKAAAEAAKGQKALREDAARARAHQERSVTWPSAGTTTLRIPATGSKSGKAGTLPVTVSAPKPSALTKTAKTAKSAKAAQSSKVAESVEVRVLDQAAAKAAGVKGVVLAVTGPTQGGTAQLDVDYSAFAAGYSGDWAGRLQMVSLPQCALATPEKKKCRTREEAEFTNRREAEKLTAPLSFTAASGGQVQLFALTAGTQSGGGDYKATALSASSTWEAGGSSGAFTWSYPLRVPPSAAGPKPELSLSYNSGAVDGRTANTNNQSSQIGEGFDLTSSYIERRYGSCDDDGQDGKNDLCWKYDNASLVLNGNSTELVKDDADATGNTWRLKNDDASKVEHLTSANYATGSGDDNDEHWRITTGNGTRYTFGMHKLPGAAAGTVTNSVWTVPVFGDDSGEPGYSSGSSLAGRSKTQAWRWNLDYVEDTHANTMSYWYKTETNNYDTLGDDSTGTPYIRGGYPWYILYGQRAGSMSASNKVSFTTAERCDASGTGCDSLTDVTRDNWPDVPFDAICKDGDKCTGNTGPSFFSRKRITDVDTFFWDAAAATPGYAAVDSWALNQTYLDPGDTGDSTDQSLWLSSVQHVAKHGTDITTEPVKFTHTWLVNRVDGASDDMLPLTKPRVRTVLSETGAHTVVSYLTSDCTAAGAKPALDNNTKRCYPVNWAPNGGDITRLDWFQKYPVSAVTTTDTAGGSEPITHSYTYSGPGWHYNDDPFTKEKERTWSSWRGYERVTHLTGVSTATQSKTLTIYMQGMHGDRNVDGTTDTVSVTGIKAPAATDYDHLAGFVRESITYNGAATVTDTVNSVWAKRTATQHKSYADTEAYFVRTSATHTHTQVTSGLNPTDRIRRVYTSYDDVYGLPYKVEDQGDDAVTGDESCAYTWYVHNTGAWVIGKPIRVRTVGKACTVATADLDLPADATRSGDVISDVATAYDNLTWSASQQPTKGDVTWTGRVIGYNTTTDGAIWQKTTSSTYDTLGRIKSVADTNGQTTATTDYTPAAGGALTSFTVTNAKGHATVTETDPATGTALKVTDPNNSITESTYDALGRVSQTWLPNRSRLGGKTPNYTYAYQLGVYNETTGTSTPSWVSTSALKGDGSGYNTAYEFYDAALRPRQAQTPSPTGGMLVGQTLYDERGLAITTESDIWDSTKSPSSTMVEVDTGQAPVSVRTSYDGAARPIKAETYTSSTPRWTTTSTYTGDTTTTTAPAGGQAITTVTDARGQTVERREYPAPTATGTPATTTFTYTPGGQQKTITGPDNKSWSYAYDLHGRLDIASDPDKGASDTDYNTLDQVTQTSDAEGRTLLFEYDVLGRKTGSWQTSKTDANKLAAWSFDTLKKGQLDSSTRYDGGTAGKAYTDKVTAYDAMYQVTANELTLPTTDPLVAAGVPSTLAFTTGYRLDGSISQHREPAVAGLASEAVSYTYNATGQQLTAKGTTGYLQNAAYSPQGDLRQLTLGTATTAGKWIYLTNDYEAGTRRLTRSYATDDVNAYMTQELKFTQDDAGNVKSIFDATTNGGATKADYQCFTYDGHRRLAEAWTPKTADCASSGRTTANLDGAAPYWNSYTYNSAGQRLKDTKHTASGDTVTDYTYGTTTGQPHPLAKTTTGATVKNYTYDDTGNTLTRPGTQATQTLTWNTEGKLAKTTEPAAGTKPAKGTNYLYDASGELLIRRPTTTDGETVLYLGQTEVRLNTTGGGATKALTGTRYYTAAGQNIAVRTTTTTSNTLDFLTGDHHGTMSLAMDATTLAVTKRYTTPFGAPRGTTTGGPWPDDKAFLGKPADTGTGLTHIGAREYDPGIAQFISVDPILESDKAQTLNGYSYSINNPLTFSDPTGTKLGCGGIFAEGCPKTKPGPPSKPDGGDGGTHPCNSNCGGGGGGLVGASGGSENSGPTVNLSPPGELPEGFEEIYYRELALGEKAIGGALLTSYEIGVAGVNVCEHYKISCSEAIFDYFMDIWYSDLHQFAITELGPIGGGSISVRGYTKAAISGYGPKLPQVKVSFGCNCFRAGTDVLMADGTAKDIEDVKLGDKVMARDPETGEEGAREVTRLIATEDDKHFNKLSVATEEGIEPLTATHEHPFWSPSENRWVEAGDLRPGMSLLTDEEETVLVTANKPYTLHARTYNLTVDDLHTYYVLAGETPVLVHNSNCDVAGRGLWQLTKEGSTKLLKGGPFKTTFYKSASDGTWWTPDVTGHGESAFKVYRETSKGFEWISDADKYGDYMPDKWKGDTGKFIPNGNLRGVKR